MKTIRLAFLSACLSLVVTTQAQAFAIRSQRPSMESMLQGALDGILLAMPEVAADAGCRAPEYRELFPDFRGSFDGVRRSSSFPPTMMNHHSVVGFSLNNQTVYPPDYTCHQSRGASCWQAARRGSFTTTEASLETAAIRGFCLRRWPQAINDIFTSGGDFPAEFAGLWSEEYLRYRWERSRSGGMASLRNRFHENDIVSLYELNLRAARLWERALACYSRNAEAARAAYARADFSCRAGADPALASAVAEFRQDIRSYFATSFFRTPELLMTSRLDIAWRLTNGQPLMAEATQSHLPSIHPLFSQVVLELQMENFPIEQRVRAEQLGARLSASGQDRFFLALAQFDHYVVARGAHHFGLWPVGARAARFWAHYRLMGMIVAETAGMVEQRSPVAIPTDIDHQRLPDFYTQNAQAIAIAMREVGRRYETLSRR